VGAFYSVHGLAAAAALILAGALAAGIRPWELLRGSKPILFPAAFIILIRTLRFGAPGPRLTAAGLAAALPALSLEGFAGGLHQGLCFITSFSAGALLFSVTTMQELRDSLERRIPGRFALGLSLMLGFLPRFFEIWETANLAFEARAGKRGLRRLIILIPLIMERMMETAGETAEALDSRGLSLRL
jgi:biotin transport system permease protein